MEQNALKRIKDIIEYIEEHLLEPLTLDSIAAYSGFSKYHLHKIFKYTTGEKLMDYVRLRRLSLSVEALETSDLKIIDIANEYLFDYEQSFIRAFKKQFQISPNRFRKERPELNRKKKADLDYMIPVGQHSIVFKPKIQVKPPLKCVGIPSLLQTNCEEEYEVARTSGIQFYNKRSGEIPHKKNKDIFMALSKCLPGGLNERVYMPCAEVKWIGTLPEGMKSCTLGETRYAVFKQISFRHPSRFTEELRHLNHYIFEEWFPSADYIPVDGFVIERSDLSAANQSYGEYEMWIPVVEKTEPSSF